MKTTTKILLTSLFFLSCSDKSERNSDSESASDFENCTPGYESCECINENQCLSGLNCISKVCVKLDDTTSDNSTSNDSNTSNNSDSNSDESTTNNSEPECELTSDCFGTNLCISNECVEITNFYFNVTVIRYTPDTCSDGVGTAEIKYDYYMNNKIQFTSSESPTCPGIWEDVVEYDPSLSFSLDFWEVDTFSDDFYETFCWQDGNGNCVSVPKQILYDGIYEDQKHEILFDAVI